MLSTLTQVSEKKTGTLFRIVLSVASLQRCMIGTFVVLLYHLPDSGTSLFELRFAWAGSGECEIPTRNRQWLVAFKATIRFQITA